MLRKVLRSIPVPAQIDSADQPQESIVQAEH